MQERKSERERENEKKRERRRECERYIFMEGQYVDVISFEHTCNCSTACMSNASMTCEYIHTAMHCNALQPTATHCNMTHTNDLEISSKSRDSPHNWRQQRHALHHTLQHTTAHCNTLQRTATHYNTLQHDTHQRSRDVLQVP